MPGVHCGSKGCGPGGPDAPPTPKPPPGGKQKCSPGAHRTSNGDCIPGNRGGGGGGGGASSGNSYQQDSANQRAWNLAHPSKALALIRSGKSQLDMAQNSSPKGVAHLARFTARLQAKVDRHAAVVARRQARNASRDHLA